MSDGISAQNTYLTMGDGTSPQVFAEVPECTTIPGPAGTSDEIDFTHLRSTGGYREYKQSFKDNDDMTMECNYIPGDPVQAAIRAAYLAGTVIDWVKHYPDGSTDAFSGYVKSASSPAAVGDKMGFTFTLRVTGAPVFTSS